MIRSGLQAIVNVYDLAALEAALRIREQCGGEVHVFTMGPDKAEMVLRKLLQWEQMRISDLRQSICRSGCACNVLYTEAGDTVVR